MKRTHPINGILIILISLVLTQPAYSQKAQVLKPLLKRAANFMVAELTQEVVKEGIVKPAARAIISETKIEEWTQRFYDNSSGGYAGYSRKNLRHYSEELEVARHVVDSWSEGRANIYHLRKCPTCYRLASEIARDSQIEALFTSNRIRMEVPTFYKINNAVYKADSRGYLYAASIFSGRPMGPVQGYLWHDGYQFYGVNLYGQVFLAAPVDFAQGVR